MIDTFSLGEDTIRKQVLDGDGRRVSLLRTLATALVLLFVLFLFGGGGRCSSSLASSLSRLAVLSVSSCGLIYRGFCCSFSLPLFSSGSTGCLLLPSVSFLFLAAAVDILDIGIFYLRDQVVYVAVVVSFSAHDQG